MLDDSRESILPLYDGYSTTEQSELFKFADLVLSPGTEGIIQVVRLEWRTTYEIQKASPARKPITQTTRNHKRFNKIS